MSVDSGKLSRLHCQFLADQMSFGPKIKGLQLHGPDAVEKLGHLIPQTKGLLVHKGAAAAFAVEHLQPA